MLKALVYEKAALASTMTRDAKNSLVRLAISLTDEESGFLSPTSHTSIARTMECIEIKSRHTYYNHLHEWITHGYVTTVSSVCSGRSYLLVFKTPNEDRATAIARALNDSRSRRDPEEPLWVSSSLERERESAHPAQVEVGLLGEDIEEFIPLPSQIQRFDQSNNHTVEQSSNCIIERSSNCTIQQPSESTVGTCSARPPARIAPPRTHARAPGEFYSPGDLKEPPAKSPPPKVPPVEPEGGGGGQSWIESEIGFSLDDEDAREQVEAIEALDLYLSALIAWHGKEPPKNRRAARSQAREWLELAKGDESLLRYQVSMLLNQSPNGKHLGYYLKIAKREAPGWVPPGKFDLVEGARRKRIEMNELRDRQQRGNPMVKDWVKRSSEASKKAAEESEGKGVTPIINWGSISPGGGAR